MAEYFCIYDTVVRCIVDQSKEGWEKACRTCPIMDGLKSGKGCTSVEF